MVDCSPGVVTGAYFLSKFYYIVSSTKIYSVMKNVIIIILLLPTVLLAQKSATTEDGRKVTLNSDGTWYYIDQVNVQENNPASYDCTNLIVTETDKVSGEVSTAASDMLVISKDGGENGFGIYPMKGTKSVIVSIQAVGAGRCIDDDDKMNVLFRDGTRIEVVNSGKFNCDARFSLYLGGVFGKKRELESLSSKEVETLRVWTNDGYVEEDFSTDQSKILMNTIYCLANL